MMFVPIEIVGSKGLNFELIQKECQFKYYLAQAVQYIFAAYVKTATADMRSMSLQEAQTRILWAVYTPKMERTGLALPSKEDWQRLSDLKSDIFENFEFSHKLSVALNELLGDLYYGRITDASLLKLETALSFELEGGSDKDFFLAIYKISYDHGQYDKKVYEMECRQVRENGVPKL